MSSFNVGDQIRVRPWDNGGTVGEILCFRQEIGNHRTGALSYGCDVLLSNGKTQFRYMHDVTRDNPDRMEALRLAAAAPEMLAALKEAEKQLAEVIDCYSPQTIPENVAACKPFSDAIALVRAAIAKAEG